MSTPLAPAAVRSEPAGASASAPVRRALGRHALPLAVWLLCILYVAARLTRGWVPHDEGSIAQSAERLLQGELPHRDFADLYTGGLTYYHAAAFRLLGTSLVSLRIAMFVVFAAWVPVFHKLASRVAPPLGAAALTVLAVAWSVPSYPVSLPSWYNLFFATFGAAALLRFADTGRSRWVVLAGVCGGVSFLAKVVGVYFVAAGLLFLVYHEQRLAERDAAAGRAPSAPARGFAMFVTLSLAVFVGALLALVRSARHAAEVAHFVVPGAALAALLVRRAWSAPWSLGPSGERVARLARLIAPFAAGALVPVAIFLVPYVASGALGDFVQGVLVLPQRRLAFTVVSPPSPLTFVVALPLLYLLLVATPPSRDWRFWLTMAAAAGAGLWLIGRGHWWRLNLLAWLSARALPPLLAVLGAVVLSRRRAVAAASDAPPDAAMAAAPPDEVAMLLLSVMATFALVQFPFAAPVYFCYVAPTVVLAAAALATLPRASGERRRRPASVAATAVVVAYTLFAVLVMHPGYIYTYSSHYQPEALHSRLDGARGGLRVSAEDSAEMARVTALIAAHARPGEYIYAGPDAPQVYYLAGMRNPTPTLFDFFEDSLTHDARVLRAIDSHRVRVVVVNRDPQFSRATSARLDAELSSRFPRALATQHYEVRWRD